MRARFLALVIAICGCGSSDAEFATKYASDFRREGATISVFGVYKDGRMSADAWNDLSPRFASVFGSGSCEVVYGDALLANDAALASAIDDRARLEGVTDELAGVFAPAAAGDAIALVTVLGFPSNEPRRTGASKTQSGPTTSSMRGGRRGGRSGGHGGGQPTPQRDEDAPHDAFEVSISFYSVREHRTVGVVSMKYNGTNPDAGVAGFVEKVRAELPNAKCLGWKHDVRIDADRVRAARPSE
jgi:hypothetical protein